MVPNCGLGGESNHYQRRHPHVAAGVCADRASSWFLERSLSYMQNLVDCGAPSPPQLSVRFMPLSQSLGACSEGPA
eukprot:6354782-Alexandrium_andersonii.AAC.1